ncbi:MAG: M23 family metallopeptidase, partial [Candidatus Zixiibacteriota bacterium]
YYVDLYFPPDSIRVKQGQLVAYSGKTGVGAPHLHFERRSSDNTPLNPLVYGYHLAHDTVPPVFARLGVQVVNESGLLPDGNREEFYAVKPGDSAGVYRLDDVLYLDRPFGLLVDCYDKMRPKGMKQTVYALRLTVDGTPVYEVKLDSLPFELGENVYHEYDYVEAINGNERVRRLFDDDFNKYPGSQAFTPDGGKLGPKLTNGLHTVAIRAEDNSGNVSRLEFQFIWNGLGDLFRLDSTVTVSDSTRHLFFSARGDLTPFAIDTTIIERNVGTAWKQPEWAHVIARTDSTLVVAFNRRRARFRAFRLTHLTRSGVRISDGLFNGLLPKGQKGLTISYEIVGNGLMVTAESNARFAIQSRLLLFDGDSLLGVEHPDRFLNMAEYRFYVPPRPQYRQVTRLGVVLAADSLRGIPKILDSLNIHVVGVAEADTIAIDSQFVAVFSKDNFFEPRFVAARAGHLQYASRYGVVSPLFELQPPVFVTRTPFNVTLKLADDGKTHRNDYSGLCWFDSEDEKWVWISDSLARRDTVIGESLGGGIFAALYDREAPILEPRNIVDGRTYDTPQPVLTFTLDDSLAGIADDRSILITVDDKWMIPEYDPEDGLLVTQPVDPLPDKEHIIRVKATDRAGNTTLKGWRFYTRTPKPRSGRKK